MTNTPQNSPTECPSGCPNRKGKLGKGYSYLLAIAVTVVLGFSSIDAAYSKSDGWVLKTKNLPLSVILPGLLLVGSSLGINTDPLAQGLATFLSSGKRIT